ncbi:hypothetical protein [Maricaulis sp.]|uniref:hypothetical protein n=1 Tax=Maricaulis sp. TaxID=1486257 RepID=UPI001B162B6C|nr:hypothetical protein [Maricaulis sp.]MBO6798278.1 hypothetical protein [Maricaulis sp.]
MRNIYLGYSTVFDAVELRSYFDYDEEHPEGWSKYKQNIGFVSVDPEGFEPYGLDSCPSGRFDPGRMNSLLPFRVEDAGVWRAFDFEKIKAVFFVEAEKVKQMSDESVSLVGPIQISAYDYEQ